MEDIGKEKHIDIVMDADVFDTNSIKVMQRKNISLGTTASPRKRSIFDISYDEMPGNGSDFSTDVPDGAANDSAVVSSKSTVDISSVLKDYAEEITANFISSSSDNEVASSPSVKSIAMKTKVTGAAGTQKSKCNIKYRHNMFSSSKR